MAVAEKPASKSATRNPVQQLALASLTGAVFIAASFCFVVSGIPTLWDYWLGLNQVFKNDFLATALVMLLSVGAAVGLFLLGRKLEGPHPLRGQRAGAFIGAALLLLIFIITMDWIGAPLVARSVDPIITWVMVLAVTGGLLFGMYWMYHRPGFAKFLVGVEENGWFSSNSFKFNQGQKVRRSTLVALLVLIAGGIYGNLRSNMFGRGNWEIPIPGTDLSLVALFNVNYMVPFLLFCLLGWLAWRAINWPAFADFLIATEAEMNKVSWTTRKRLIQDTIVVLVTVFLFTAFLFIVDIVWIQVLRVPGVLQINPAEARAKQMAPTDW